MNRECILVLVDAGLSNPDITLQLLADDLSEALEVYERIFASDTVPARPFPLQTIMLSHESLPLPPDSSRPVRLYALSCTDNPDPTKAAEALTQLREQCNNKGVAWQGGAALPGGRLVAPCANGPRMGRMRRSQSETIDRLILAMRCGCSLSDLLANEQALAEHNPRTRKPCNTDTDIIVARCPVPFCIYNQVATFYESKRISRHES